MNGNSQNNFRGGWNNMPPTHFSRGQIPHGIGPRAFAHNWHIPHQMPAYYAHNPHIPHQAPTYYPDNRHIPHQAPAYYPDNRHIPHQAPAHYVDNRNLPHQKPTDKLNPKDMKNHKEGKRFRRRLLKLLEQTKRKPSSGEEIRHNQSSQISKEVYAANKCLSQQTPKDCADKSQLPDQTSEQCADKNLSQQTPKNCADKRQLADQTSEQYADKNLSPQTPNDCADKRQLSDQTSEQYADKNLSQQTPKDSADKKCLPQQTPEDCANKKCLPLLLQKCEICDLKLDPKSMDSHIKGKRHRRRLTELREQSTKHKTSNGEEIRPNRSSQTSYKRLQPMIRCEICNVQLGPKCLKYHNNGLKHKLRVLELREKSMKHKGSNGKEISHIQSSQINPVVQPVAHVPAEMSKRKVRDNTDAKDHGFKHEIEGATGGKYMKMNNGIRGSVKNDQAQSTPVELMASAGANIIAEKEYVSCDFAATVIPQGPVASHVFTPPPPAVESSFEPKNRIDLPREVTVAKEHQCGVETNDELQLISMDAVGSSFEPGTEHGLDTETEPHMSEAILYTESQHPTEETDIELLPPVLMETDVALEVSAETKTEDGNSQAEMKMDVDLSPESGKTKLLKVSVCLTCGDKGFEKSIVYCSKCGDYAMHRYCLARPVAFTDKVTWFCMDCEEVVVEAERPNSETPESKKDEVVCDPQPIADPIWRGSLQVFNKSFDKIRGLMGHLSTLASPKVLEEASHLPDVLYANLLQRSAVWPESFKKFRTNNLSIGLYFFPENERVERYYDQLVDEMISKDLAIRVMVEKTELIIFPSTLLPRQYKRFHSKYYLWGIFKSKSQAP
ncbi:hypothetical protein RYX36_009130 [Vicia faba]